MASALYPSFKALLLGGDIDLANDTIKAALIDTGTYTYSSAHDFYNDLSGVVGTPGTLASKSITSGVFDAADQVYSSVSGASVEAVVLYKDTGNTATSDLIAYIDGISVTPNGGNITVAWDNGSSKIFAL